MAYTQAIYKDEYDRINKLSYFKSSLASGINKLRDTAFELGSKYTFFKTWNSLLNNNGSLNHPVITSITYGKTLRLISLPNVKTEYLCKH